MHQDSDSETDESGSAKGSTDSYFNSGAQIDFESSSTTQNSSKTVKDNGKKEESCFTDSDDDDGEALLTVRGIENIATASRDQAPLAQLHLIPKRTHSTVSRVNDDTDQWGADDLAAQTEYTLSLTDTKLKDALMSRVNTFRRNRELCDVVLFVKEHEILAHKLVLASISPALFDMFLNDSETGMITPTTTSTQQLPNSMGSKDGLKLNMSEKTAVAVRAGASTKQLSFYEFSQGDFDCFEAIVNFAYTSKLQISSKKVAELYKTAYCLQVFPVASACARYLAEHLSFNNCIGIRKQANFNNDAFLVDKVDLFITDNFDKIIADSLEFTQLPCIKARIIVQEVQRDEHTGIYLSEKVLEYFQKHPRLTDRLDQQKENEKCHLLFMGQESQLQDCCEMDDQSSVGSCEVVQDYKRAGKKTKHSKNGGGHSTNNIGTQPIQHRVTGAMAVKMNASRVSNAKYASSESLNSMASSASTEDEIESRIIAVNKTSGGFWTVLAVLYRRLVVLSIQLSENDDFVFQNKHNSDHNQNDDQCITPRATEAVETGDTPMNPIQKSESCSSGNVVQAMDTHQVRDLTPPTGLPLATAPKTTIQAEIEAMNQKKVPLKSMSQARCAIGAVFLNGQIVIFGGYNRGECLNSAEEYDVLKEVWRPLPNMCTERGRFDSAVVDGKVYAIAGSNGNNDLKTCECYDPKLGQWTPIKSLSKARSHNGCATLDGLIYCLGGSSDQVVLKDCERYCPQKDKWEPIAPMNTARFQTGCTSWRGLIVCCGGTDRWSCLDTVEAYEPRTDSWRLLSKLSTPRRGCAVSVIRDNLYVIGGHDGTQSLASVEVLEHPNANWRPGPSLTTPRANTHAVVTAGNSIYVIGGFNNGNQFLSTIEVLENEPLGWRNWQRASVNPDSNVITEVSDDGQENENQSCDTKKTELKDSSSTEAFTAKNTNSSSSKLRS